MLWALLPLKTKPKPAQRWAAGLPHAGRTEQQQTAKQEGWPREERLRAQGVPWVEPKDATPEEQKRLV